MSTVSCSIFVVDVDHSNRLFNLGTIAEGSPIVPISAQLKYNIEVICEYICKKIPVPVRDFTSKPRLIGKMIHNNVAILNCLRLQFPEFTGTTSYPS